MKIERQDPYTFRVTEDRQVLGIISQFDIEPTVSWAFTQDKYVSFLLTAEMMQIAKFMKTLEQEN